MTITFDQAEFTFDEIRDNGGLIADGLPQELRQACFFCHAWLNGRTEFVFHTSGTTGMPKQITASRERMTISAKATIAALRLTEKENILVCLSTETVAGAMMLVRGMILGAGITIIKPSSDIFPSLPADHRFTFTSFVPMQLFPLLQNEKNLEKLNGFRNVLVGGAAMSEALEMLVSKSGARVFQTYGMTETLSHIALKETGKDACFYPLPGVELKTDDRGCLCVKSGVTGGEWVVTNDLAEVGKDNGFTIKGRIDEVINTGGMKVFPGEVEKALQLLLPGRKLFVYGRADERLGRSVTALIEGRWQDEEALRKKLGETLHSFQVPKRIFFLEKFPLTVSGKTDKLQAIAQAEMQQKK